MPGQIDSAADLDWDTEVTPYLRPDEWPEGVLGQMDARVVLALSDLREKTDVPMIPSPVSGAHVRDGTSGSRHSVHGGDRLSDATDFFVPWVGAEDVWDAANRHPGIGGIGLYDQMMLRGTPGELCMVHIDCREEEDIAWIGHGRTSAGRPQEYVYCRNEPDRFQQLFDEIFNAKLRGGP